MRSIIDGLLRPSAVVFTAPAPSVPDRHRPHALVHLHLQGLDEQEPRHGGRAAALFAPTTPVLVPYNILIPD